MKVFTFFVLLLIMFVPTIYGEDTLRSVKSIETDNEAARYFECRAIKATDLKDDKAPTFQDYRVALEAPVEHPRVDTKTTPIGRRYRTVLRKGIASGANYAGHFTVVIWGCGTSCSSFAVVNLKTGQVIVPTGISTVTWDHLENTVERFLPDGLHGYWGYRYRPDSRLLVLVGMLNEDDNREGAWYFVLENNRLRQVHQTRVVKNCDR
jgi:hypothetical protein